MRWISNLDRKFVLPILLGISLTTFSCVSLAVWFYPMFEKDDDTKDDNDHTKKSSQIVTSRCTTVECKVPKQYVSAIIGKGGSMIKNIQDKTGTHITMTDNDIESSDRFCIIRGNEMEGIRLAESMIKNIIDNQPVIETYEMFVPYEVGGNFGILKKNGTTVLEIQRSSGTKLIVESNIYKSEDTCKRRIVITGSAEKIALAVNLIKDKIQLKCEQTTIARTPRSSPSKNRAKDTMDNQPTVETYEFSLPNETRRRIIEKNENDVQQIERYSGDEKGIEIRTNGYLEVVTPQLKDKIQEENKTQPDLNDDLTAIDPSPNNSIDNSTLETSSEGSDETMYVYVTAVETPNLFWVHVVGPWNETLENLVKEMTEYYNKEENRKNHVLTKVTNGQQVAAKCSYDNNWYRAEVMSVDDSQCEVFFTDYGNFESLSIDNIFELRTEMLSLRLQALECTLANIQPRGSMWDLETCKKFSELVHVKEKKPLIATIKCYEMCPLDHEKSRYPDSSVPWLELYDKDGDKEIDIIKTLIDSNMAENFDISGSSYSECSSNHSHDEIDSTVTLTSCSD
ncbi:tudor and KH domain-containing protein homolog isoform X2 [Anoplolepis gracilipes]|uniref:tudor and KH domain-containing protein homolog isoform X2 n=1 Tax=Anoplolepis gracilipes TaxID=354296 RepID=UPI003B9F8527